MAKKLFRFLVTGPGLEDISYEYLGPAISRSLTAASESSEDGTWYVRDGVNDDKVLGYSERIEDVVLTVSHVKMR